MTNAKLQQKNWQKSKLGDFVVFNYGKGLPERERVPGPYPVYGSAGQVGTHNKYIAEGPGIIVGRKGSVGEIYYTKNNYCPIDTVYYITKDEKYDLSFLYYLLQTIDFKALNSDVAVPGLNRNTAYDQDVLMPDVATQRNIGHVLSTYDDLIENNTKRIKILEEITQAIYKEWFNKERGEMTKLENCFLIYRGKSYRSEELSDSEGVPFVNLKCLDRDGGFRKSGLKRFIGTYKESQKVIAGDIVVAVTDMTQDRRIVAHAARIPTLEGGFGVISMDLVKLQPKENCDPDYLYCLLRWSGFSDEVKNHANGANVLHLNPARITDYKTFVASPEKQKEFGYKVHPIFDLIDRLELQNEVLRPARDLLLPKLVTGDIEVQSESIPKNELMSYLNKLFKKTKDNRLAEDKVRLQIIRMMDEASKITKLSFSELLKRLDFKPQDLTIEALESFLAELRSIVWLRDFSFTNIVPLKAKKKNTQPDFSAQYGNKTCVVEVFCLTQKHEQQKDPSLNAYKNFDPNFEGSKFGRDFISTAKDKKLQLDSMKADIKILLCVVNSQPMIRLNTKTDFENYAELLHKKLSWGNGYYLGILTGVSANGVPSDTIFPKLNP